MEKNPGRRGSLVHAQSLAGNSPENLPADVLGDEDGAVAVVHKNLRIKI
jgi:hypothetical protein